MGDGYIKFMRAPDTVELLKRPNEFALLGLIAYRAKRTNSFSVYNLKPGEALIGDHRACGLTEQKYRTAKKHLEMWGFITCRATNKGTIATLKNHSVFDPNVEERNERDSETITDKQRTNNGQATTTKKSKREKNGKNGKNTIPPTPPEIPPWLTMEAWGAFEQHRKDMKAPLTPEAERRALKRLSTLRDEGHDPEAVIDQSIVSGWKGLFPVNGRKPDKRRTPLNEDFNSKEYTGTPPEEYPDWMREALSDPRTV